MNKKESGHGLRRSQRDYTLAFKLRVVSEVEKGIYSYKQAQKVYGIQGRSTVLVWLRKHGTLEWALPKLHSKVMSGKTPEQRIKELEAALDMEKKKNLFLTTAIDIIENEYGLPVRKKLSTKQPGGSKKKGK